MSIGAEIPEEYRERGVDTAALRRLAVESDADPRTVARVLAGERVHGAARRRIYAVLLHHKLAPCCDSHVVVFLSRTAR